MPELTVISLGWGVQSFTLAAMAALGELPPVDAAIHADTTHERQATYQFAARWAPWLEARGVRVVTVRDPSVAPVALPGRGTMIPAHTRKPNGDQGQLGRTCTNRWKIAPMRAWLRAELTRRGSKQATGAVEQWIGISLDEFQRMRTSDVQYIMHRYPLVDRRMTRADCIAWLQAHDLEVPGKSACVFCPFHNTATWQELKRAGGPDWDRAILLDQELRHQREKVTLFVHYQARPLAEAVSIPEDQGLVQAGLFDRPELETTPCDNGGCFI